MHADLNLLQALDALLDEGSVSRAAARLHLSQPAMSRTLTRIREATGDPILVRVGRGMVPSARAQAIRAEVRSVVKQGRALLAPERAFDPAQLERAFTIQCHDALLGILAGPLVARLRRRAPRAAVRFLGENARDLDELGPGRVDLDVGATARRAPRVHREELGHDALAVMLRADHVGARGKLTLPRYADALHVVISRRGKLSDPIDEALEERGLRRRVIASVPTCAAALQLVEDEDVVVTMAARACTPLARARGLRVRPLPLATAPVPVVLSWHAHFEADEGHRFLRALTRDVLVEALQRPATRLR